MNQGGSDINQGDADMAPPPPPPPPPPSMRPTSRRRVISGRTATAALAGGLVVGGIAGGYVITQAAAPTLSPSASAGAPFHGGLPGAGPASRPQDLQQVASVIGVTVAQMQSELAAGKTIAAVAAEHHVSASTVISTLTTDENAEIDAAVRSGRLTQAQATQMKTQTTQRVTAVVNGTAPPFGGGPGGFGGRPHGGFAGEDHAIVAGAIGITAAQLQTELSAGKTIAAIATEHNIAAATVISALAASENTEIDQRVSSGHITAAQAAQDKAQMTQRVTDEVNGTRPPGRPGDRWGGPPPAAWGSGGSPTN